jgi:hypothetical protein
MLKPQPLLVRFSKVQDLSDAGPAGDEIFGRYLGCGQRRRFERQFAKSIPQIRLLALQAVKFCLDQFGPRPAECYEPGWSE